MIKTSIAIAAAAAITSSAYAQAGQASFTIEFRYDAQKSAADNYRAFARKADRLCVTPGPQPLALRAHEQACIEDIMNKLVVRLGRADIAAIHREKTGQEAVLDLAAR